MYGIEVRQSAAGILVELWGEFDLFSLGNLCRTLNEVLDLRRMIHVDLSGITFLDLASARELAVHAQLYAHRLTLHNPSRQVKASVEAFGLASWIPYHSRADRDEPPVVSETPS